MGILALGMSFNVSADQAAVFTYYSTDSQPFTTPSSACAQDVSYLNAHPQYISATYSAPQVTGVMPSLKCVWTLEVPAQNYTGTADTSIAIDSVCPAGQTPTDQYYPGLYKTCTGSSQPECSAPKEINPLTNACQNSCLGGPKGVMYFPMPAGTTANNVNLRGNSHMCNDGCEVVMSQTDSTPFQFETRSNGSSAVAAPAEETGSFCQNGQYTPAAPNIMPATEDKQPLPTTAADCVKKGKSFGTINGVTACYSKPTNTSTQPVTNTTDNSTKSDGTAEEKSQVSSIGSDGNVTTTTTTKSTAADGTTTTKTEDKKQDQNTFCKDNPTSPMCKEQKDPCLENDDRAGCKLVGDVPASDSVGTKDTPVLTFTEIALPSNNTCPSTTTITLGGQPIPISYEWICTYASMFKPLVIAFAFFGAALIVIGQARKD
jgi:hypothetical protein